ncbi:MAG: hypothetical protein JW910_23825, partial [Anaerolineae bacterium]|nr:hypothetical protein [Anaerolineae bacterium]
DMLYVRPINNRSALVQVDTASGASFSLPLGRDLNYNSIPALDALLLSETAQIIGEPGSLEGNSLLRLLLGDNYRAQWNYHPLTVMLLDVLEPVTDAAEQNGLLLYVFDEQAGRGVLDFLHPADANQMVLHPGGTRLLVRRASGAGSVEVYDLASGALVLTLDPAVRDPGGNYVLAYSPDGGAIISDFQRFDAVTGDVLYQDLGVRPSLGDAYFTADSQRLLTLDGDQWWVWDVYTGEVVQRETVDLRGGVMDVSEDRTRFLTQIDTPDGPGIEIVDVATGERQSALFETLPNRSIMEVYPSPDWTYYLVVYSAYEYSPHYPGNEIALYHLREGRLWFLAGDDLPQPEGRGYGWLDDETIYLYSESYGGQSQPERIYGVDYHASGLPDCLVQHFPDDWPRWASLWERLVSRQRGDALDRLAVRLCAALPAPADDIDAIFDPTPRPTRPPATETPAVIAGVPACLTLRYPDQALDYAALWRELTADLTPEETAEMEELLCEGLNEANVPSPYYGSGYDSGFVVMTIDAQTGTRREGTFFPPEEGAETADRSLTLVLDEFERQYGYRPAGAFLSPDGQLLALRSSSGYFTIYRLLADYDAIAATATGFAAPPTDQPGSIRVRPTATQPFEELGGPRPTLTPTITPTSPPPAEAPGAQPQLVLESCALTTRYAISAPPEGWDPPGTLLVRVYNSNLLWRLDPATGSLRPDETLPACVNSQSCQTSFDQDWVLEYTNVIRVMRPDGSDATVLYDVLEQTYWPTSISWLGEHTLEYQYETYLPDRRNNPVSLAQQFNPESGEFSEPFTPRRSSVSINQLSTETVAVQPGGGPLVVVRTAFNSGHNTGYRYYIVDRDTGTVDYFARLAAYSSNNLDAIWHPLGRELYYRYPGGEDWYIFDAATRTHRVLGDLPDGTWSRDGRYRAAWFTLPYEERSARIEQLTATPLPLPVGPFTEAGTLEMIRVWDSITGEVRRFCIPETPGRSDNRPLLWSPDNRYLVFRIELPGDGNFDTVRPRTLILDTQTGNVVELALDVSEVVLWMQDVPGDVVQGGG